MLKGIIEWFTNVFKTSDLDVAIATDDPTEQESTKPVSVKLYVHGNPTINPRKRKRRLLRAQMKALRRRVA